MKYNMDLSKINDEKKYYKAQLGLKDMQFVIDFAHLIVHFERNGEKFNQGY